jgi:hypothetical protein
MPGSTGDAVYFDFVLCFAKWKVMKRNTILIALFIAACLQFAMCAIMSDEGKIVRQAPLFSEATIQSIDDVGRSLKRVRTNHSDASAREC